MDLRVFVVTKNAPVHFTLIDALQETRSLCGALIQSDEHIVCSTGGVFDRFNQDNKSSSDKFFGVRYSHTANLPTLACSYKDFNNEKTIDFILGCKPDLIITFDTIAFSEVNLAKLTCEKWNIHRGLSNKVRGADCHFWSSFLISGSSIGCTIHELVDNFNSGDIIHQTGVNIKKEDNVHDISSRAMRAFFSELPAVIELAKVSKLKRVKSAGAIKYFAHGEIKAEHLELIINSVEKLKLLSFNQELFRQDIVVE